MEVGKEMEDRDCLEYSTLVINLVINFSIIWWLLKEPFLSCLALVSFSVPQRGIFF